MKRSRLIAVLVAGGLIVLAGTNLFAQPFRLDKPFKPDKPFTPFPEDDKPKFKKPFPPSQPSPKPPKPPQQIEKRLVNSYIQGNYQHLIYEVTVYDFQWNGNHWEKFVKSKSKTEELVALNANNPALIGAGGPGSPPDPTSVTPPPIGDDAPVEQTKRYLRIKNNTGKKLTVHVQYKTETERGAWQWFPDDPEKSAKALEFEFDPGEASALSDKEWRINASRIRIWATAGTQAWDKYKDQDFWLVTEVDKDGKRAYLAPKMETFTFTFDPQVNADTGP